MFGLVYREVRFTSANGSEEFSGGSVTPGTFEALGIAPLFGRGLRADDYRPGAPPVFVISYGLWTKLFNRAPNVLGNTYRLNGAPVALVGVMPARFQIGACDLWLPLDITRDTFVPGAGIREREFGIRSAVGASRTHIIRQLLVESFALAAVSCALGCIFAIFGLQVMVALIPSGTIPPEAAITFSSSALLFSLIVTVFTTVACGLAPAIHALRTDAQIALSGPGKGTGVDHRQGTLRSALVVAEVALSVILTICSGLIMRSLFAPQSVNIGFNPTKVVYARILWPEGQYDSVQKKSAILRRVLDRVTRLPGVFAATETSSYPPHSWGWTTVIVQGKTPPQNRNTASIMCSEGYFQTLNRSLLRGRLFTRKDIEGAGHVVVVNQTFARYHFGEENPIGQQV